MEFRAQETEQMLQAALLEAQQETVRTGGAIAICRLTDRPTGDTHSIEWYRLEAVAEARKAMEHDGIGVEVITVLYPAPELEAIARKLRNFILSPSSNCLSQASNRELAEILAKLREGRAE